MSRNVTQQRSSNVAQLLLLGTGPTKIRLVANLALDRSHSPDQLPMVLLGLFARVLARRELLHW
jgi:hypothetical protein